ncbi:TetR/AcrR family transcriptional regulator [Paenibacillus sp. TAB 01]|uniref:TetR/AcrR family transcriptional regulator n=1 Tax=Paenibacillus sp. TAB 01 TaxID=3368988 RepID=UPI003751B86E
MSDRNQSANEEKLLLTAIDLISEKGYNGVSTKEIAATAGLSEKTLFRYFGSKQNMLETAFDRFHYGHEMTRLFQEKLTGDLSADLLLISRTYHELMNRNRKMILISIKDEGNLPGFKERTQKHPRQLLTILTNYFTEMAGKGNISGKDPQLLALSFMMMNFGAFMNDLEAGANYFPHVTLEAFIEEGVRVFTRALTP